MPDLNAEQREALIRRRTIERNLELQRRMNEQDAQTRLSPDQLTKLSDQQKSVRARAQESIAERNTTYNDFLRKNAAETAELNRQRSSVAGYDVTRSYTKDQVPRRTGNAPLRNVIFAPAPTNAANNPNRATPRTPQTPINPTNGGSLARPTTQAYPSTRELMRISDPRNVQSPQRPQTATGPPGTRTENTTNGRYTSYGRLQSLGGVDAGTPAGAILQDLAGSLVLNEIQSHPDRYGMGGSETRSVIDEIRDAPQRAIESILDRLTAKPEVKRKIYDAATSGSGSGGSSGSGGYTGRMNSATPTAGTRATLPAYTPQIADPNFPGGFVPVGSEALAKLIESNPDFNPLAGDLPSFSPADFLIPKDPDYLPPSTPVGTYNGNIPPAFSPAPPTFSPAPPGNVIGKQYYVEIVGRQRSITYISQNDGSRFTQKTDAGNAVIGTVPGKVGAVQIVAGATSTNQFTVPQTSYTFLVEVGIGTANPHTVGGGTISGDTGSVSAGGQLIRPNNPNDPDPFIPNPQPAPQVPTNPDTGRPDLPAIDLKPTIDAPTSPARAPTPSPLKSPNGNPSPVTPPQSTPRFDPNIKPTPPAQIKNAASPKSPSSPLANPTLPIGNPLTPPSTQNPLANIDLPQTGVTINGKTVQNGNTPIRQIQNKPNNAGITTGTNTTINGEPVNVPKQVDRPNGTIDPQKVEQQQQAKQPQPQPEAARETCNDPCIQGLSDKLDEQSLTTIEVNVFDKCNLDKSEAVFKKQSFKLPKSVSETLKEMLNNLAQLQGKECDGSRNAIASVPEWWQARRGSNIPQLAIVFGEQLPTGKLTTSRWTLSIPHYNRPKGARPNIPAYNKGNWFGTLRLTDGSKLGVNAASSSECKKVLNRLKIHIPVEYRTKKGKAIKPRVVEDPNADFKQCKVIPIRADYYSKGQTNLTPDWSINLRKK